MKPSKLRLSKYLSKHSAGFTLVETVVAIFVLSVGVSGAVAVMTLNLQSTTLVQQNLIASALAQEGVEVVRNIRDSYWHTADGFDPILTNGTYQVEHDSQTLLTLTGDPPLQINNGQYQYTQGEDTPFHRDIVITTSLPNRIKVESRVTWESQFGQRTVSAEMHFFNWKPTP